MGLGAVEDAMGWGIMPAVVGSGGGEASGGTSWANWDETTESGWGDQTNNLIWIMDGGASANEVGQGGGLSESDRTLTQVGDIAASSGSPPKRLVDRLAGNDYFKGTANAVKMMDGTVFTYIAKCNGMSAIGGVIEFYDGSQHLLCNSSGRFYTSGYTTDSDVSWATGPGMPTGDIYFYLIDDGTNTTWGWNITKATKLSDIPAAQRITKGAINGVQDGPSRTSLLGSEASDVNLITYVYYIVISKLCLIDTGA